MPPTDPHGPGPGEASLLQRALEEAEQYRALAEGILALSLCRSEPEIFGVLMGSAEKLFPHRHWAVGKLSDGADGRQEFELQDWTPSVHAQLGDVLRGLRLPIMATGFSHKLYFDHCIVVVEDCPNHPEQFDPVAAQRFGLRSLLGVPLVQDGHLVGVLYGLAFLHEPPLILSELQSSGLQNLCRVSALALDRRRAQAELEQELVQRKESEALYRTLVEESLSGVYLIQDGVFQYANPAFCRIFGYTEREMRGMPVGSLVAPSDRETVLNNIRKRMDGQLQSIRYTFLALGKGGREILVEVHGSSVQRHGRPAVLGVLMDVTDQRRAAKALEASEARFRRLFDDSPEAILIIDPGKGYALVNHAATLLLGRPAAEILGCEPGTLSPPLQRDGEPSAERARRVLEAAATSQPQWFDWVNLRPDGSEVESEAHLVLMPNEGHPIYQLILRDVTAARRERRERESLERQLYQAQKLESLGVMAGGVAHDFNNLLTGILGHADLALSAAGESPGLKKHLDAVRSAAVRASDLTRQLLAYSGKGAFEFRRLDLSALVEDTARLLEVSVPKAVSLRLDVGRDLPPIQGDSAQLRQVLMNLVINAAEAMEGSEGTVRITTGLETLEPEALEGLQGAPLAPGQHVILRVADTGSGMDGETLARAFEPFFTTRFTGRGLGLPALLGIVRGHGAGLRVKSALADGSVFTVFFPAAQGGAESLEVPAAAEDTPGKGLMLVVDDDAGVRGVARQALEMRGYQVIEAEDGSEALDHIRLRGNRITLVLLDATMPNMSGESTLRQIQDLRPGLPVLLSSGYDEPGTLQRFPGLGRDHFLPKPYGPRDLLARVQALLPPR